MSGWWSPSGCITENVMNRHIFSPARWNDLPAVYALIESRIRWMQERGNPQWDTYREAYPDSYFETITAEGRLWLLRQDGCVAAMVSLWDGDRRWTDGVPSLYLHNLAAHGDFPGAGAEILRRCAERARALGRQRLRLDCSARNPRLNDYYAAQGFAFVASLPGNVYYQPNLREMIL